MINKFVSKWYEAVVDYLSKRYKTWSSIPDKSKFKHHQQKIAKNIDNKVFRWWLYLFICLLFFIACVSFPQYSNAFVPLFLTILTIVFIFFDYFFIYFFKIILIFIIILYVYAWCLCMGISIIEWTKVLWSQYSPPIFCRFQASKVVKLCTSTSYRPSFPFSFCA